MQKKNSLLVLTSISFKKKVYQKYSVIIANIFKANKIDILEEKKLSTFVKDYFFYAPESKISMIKNIFKKYNNDEIDICIQKSVYRRKKIIACDMDMTVINVESINLIAEKILKNAEMEKLTKKAMSGEIKFKESILLRTKKLKGLNIDQILPLLKLIKYSPGIKQLINTMNNYGSHTMLISGGYDLIANYIGKKIGFKEIVSNKLVLKENIITGELKSSIIDREGKLKYFKNSIKKNNVPLNATLAVGDGDNDISMIKHSSLGIAWRGYPKVKEVADISLEKNFKSILYFQGFKENEFIN